MWEVKLEKGRRWYKEIKATGLRGQRIIRYFGMLTLKWHTNRIIL